MVTASMARADDSNDFTPLGAIDEPERATYSLKAFGKCLGISYSKASQMAQAGTLPVTPIRVGRAYLFKKSEVDRLLGIN